MPRALLAAACLCLLAGAARAQRGQDVGEPDDAMIRYLRRQIETHQARLDRARGGRPKAPSYAGLPESVSSTLPEDEGFVAVERVEGGLGLGSLVHLSRLPAGLKVADVVEDEEWARLPDGAAIRRDRSRGYEFWHYPPGARLLHRLYAKPGRRLVELRMELKLSDEAGGADGPWAFGIYRPIDSSGRLRLYTGPASGSGEESIELPLPGGVGAFTWKRLDPASCRDCHIDMGEGWYQYADEEHAGPCGFVPRNRSLRGDWAARYRAAHPGPVFVGP